MHHACERSGIIPRYQHPIPSSLHQDFLFMRKFALDSGFTAAVYIFMWIALFQ